MQTRRTLKKIANTDEKILQCATRSMARRGASVANSVWRLSNPGKMISGIMAIMGVAAIAGTTVDVAFNEDAVSKPAGTLIPIERAYAFGALGVLLLGMGLSMGGGKMLRYVYDESADRYAVHKLLRYAGVIDESNNAPEIYVSDEQALAVLGTVVNSMNADEYERMRNLFNRWASAPTSYSTRNDKAQANDYIEQIGALLSGAMLRDAALCQMLRGVMSGNSVRVSDFNELISNEYRQAHR